MKTPCTGTVTEEGKSEDWRYSGGRSSVFVMTGLTMISVFRFRQLGGHHCRFIKIEISRIKHFIDFLSKLEYKYEMYYKHSCL